MDIGERRKGSWPLLPCDDGEWGRDCDFGREER